MWTLSRDIRHIFCSFKTYVSIRFSRHPTDSAAADDDDDDTARTPFARTLFFETLTATIFQQSEFNLIGVREKPDCSSYDILYRKKKKRVPEDIVIKKQRCARMTTAAITYKKHFLKTEHRNESTSVHYAQWITTITCLYDILTKYSVFFICRSSNRHCSISSVGRHHPTREKTAILVRFKRLRKSVCKCCTMSFSRSQTSNFRPPNTFCIEPNLCRCWTYE